MAKTNELQDLVRESRIVVDCAGLMRVAEAIEHLAQAVHKGLDLIEARAEPTAEIMAEGLHAIAQSVDGLSGKDEGKNYLLGCAQMIEELGSAVRKTSWVMTGKDNTP